jgi:hypothetical protein
MTTQPDTDTDTATDTATGTATGTDRRPSDLVRSVSRALAVLEVIGEYGGPMSAKAVARRTGLNLSTAYHLLRTLCWEGYLVRLSTGDYRLGGGVARRYRDLVTGLSAPPAVRGVLDRLGVHTRLTAYLGRNVDGHLAITDLVDGSASPRVDRLAPGFDQVVLDTPLAQLLPSGPVPAPGDPAATSRVVVQNGRLAPDVSSAAVVVRRHAGGEGPPTLWGIGLVGPLGWFGEVPGALRALLHAAEELTGLRNVPLPLRDTPLHLRSVPLHP